MDLGAIAQFAGNSGGGGGGSGWAAMAKDATDMIMAPVKAARAKRAAQEAKAMHQAQWGETLKNNQFSRGMTIRQAINAERADREARHRRRGEDYRGLIEEQNQLRQKNSFMQGIKASFNAQPSAQQRSEV
jgi:hypothetical protein